MHRQPRTLRLALAAGVALALALGVGVAAAVIVSGSSGHGSASSRASSTVVAAGAAAAFAGAALPANIVAPPFTLSDQEGRRVSLAQYRGQVVVLTFLYSTCGGPCVLIAQQIRGALDELSGHVPTLIVSANPASDSPAHVRRFLSEAALSGLAQYLTGPPALLRQVWAAYHVKPASAGSRVFDEYASVLLIDPSGSERVVFQSEQLTPESLSHDIQKLK
jgi:protein SCO1